MDDLEAVREIVRLLDGFSDADKSRILRWVSEKLDLRIGVTPDLALEGPADQDQSLEIDPRVALRTAIRKNDLQAVYELLPRFREIGAMDALLAASAVLAIGGAREGAESLNELIQSDNLTDEQLQKAYGSLVQYYNVRDDEHNGLRALEEPLRTLAERSHERVDQAFYLNQLGRLYYGARRFEDALAVQAEAATKAPEESAYQYNAALILKHLGRLEEASNYARQLLKTNPTDPDHLETALEILLESGDHREAERLLETYRALHEERARVFLADHPEIIAKGLRLPFLRKLRTE